MREHTASRRSVLKSSGPVALLGLAGATGLASAYSLDVRTDGYSNVTDTSATLEGTLADLGDSDTVYVQFAYSEQPDGGGLLTNHEAMSSTGSFSHDISNLEPGTTYEFYARAESEDGSTVDTGQTLEFTTDSGDGGGGGDPGPSPE